MDNGPLEVGHLTDGPWLYKTGLGAVVAVQVAYEVTIRTVAVRPGPGRVVSEEFLPNSVTGTAYLSVFESDLAALGGEAAHHVPPPRWEPSGTPARRGGPAWWPWRQPGPVPVVDLASVLAEAVRRPDFHPDTLHLGVAATLRDTLGPAWSTAAEIRLDAETPGITLAGHPVDPLALATPAGPAAG